VLPLVLSRCDDPTIYDRPFVADAYAYVHLLDRYCRFWQALAELVNARVLPMRQKGVDVLDVGTGLAPALYAVWDFYSALMGYAGSIHCSELETRSPHLQAIESSIGLVHVMHILSELAERPGPFRPTFRDFSGLNLGQTRKDWRMQRIAQIEQEDEMGWDYARSWVHENEPRWNDELRFNLCIFSNFLTSPDRVTQLEVEIKSVFRELRPAALWS
jgi:hypothetical protein